MPALQGQHTRLVSQRGFAANTKADDEDRSSAPRVQKQRLRHRIANSLPNTIPDKVSHPGDEFLDLAGKRTKELIEAHDYSKSKHGFR